MLPADWCEVLVAPMRRSRTLLGIGGAVDTARQTDSGLGQYLPTFAAFASPIEAQADRALRSPIASYKRAALATPVAASGGLAGFERAPMLLREGRVAFDPGAACCTCRHQGLRRMLRSHFHNGRTTTGLLHGELPATERRARALHTLRLPWLLTRQNVRHAWRRRHLRRWLVLASRCWSRSRSRTLRARRVGLAARPGSQPLGVGVGARDAQAASVGSHVADSNCRSRVNEDQVVLSAVAAEEAVGRVSLRQVDMLASRRDPVRDRELSERIIAMRERNPRVEVAVESSAPRRTSIASSHTDALDSDSSLSPSRSRRGRRHRARSGSTIDQIHAWVSSRYLIG